MREAATSSVPFGTSALDALSSTRPWRARRRRILNARAEALHPPLDGQELEVLERVLGGQTDKEIAEGMRVDLSVTQREVAALADRLMSPARGASRFGDPTLTGGKHRRVI